MNDSFGGDFSASQAATGSGGAASEKRAEGIAPVFIKQLLQATENNFTMWGFNFGMISCVAIVRSIEPSSTKITYTLEDHTGRIEAHYWLEDGDDADNFAPDIMLNNYALVYGCLRSQGEQKTLMVFRLVAVNDPNIITTHALEMLNARYSAEDFQKKSNECFGINEAGGSAAITDRSTSNAASNLDPKQAAILNAVRENMASDASEGISRKELQAKFRHLSSSELTALLEFLTGEGHIYSTIDADHFQATD